MLIVSALYGARSQEFHSPRHMCCDDVTIKVIWFENFSGMPQITEIAIVILWVYYLQTDIVLFIYFVYKV